MTLQEYEKITGYAPAPGAPCPECKAVCGGGGPDHHSTCTLMAKLWYHEKSPQASIPALPGIDPNDPKFGIWASKMSTTLFSQPVALPKGGHPVTTSVPAAVPAPLVS